MGYAEKGNFRHGRDSKRCMTEELSVEVNRTSVMDGIIGIVGLGGCHGMTEASNGLMPCYGLTNWELGGGQNSCYGLVAQPGASLPQQSAAKAFCGSENRVLRSGIAA